MQEESALTVGKALTMAGMLLILFAGWIFTIVIQAQQHLRDRQELLAERVSHLEAVVHHLKDEHQHRCATSNGAPASRLATTKIKPAPTRGLFQ